MDDEPDPAGAPRGVAAARTERRPAAIDPPARDFIAEHLRALFRDANREPLPEALQALLDRLAREEDQ